MAAQKRNTGYYSNRYKSSGYGNSGNRNSGSKKSRKRFDKRRLIVCALVEVTVLSVLFVMIGWKYGVGDWFAGFSQPVVKSVDLSDLNSPYAVLIQAKGGSVIGEKQSEAVTYPASLTKMMTAIVAIENLKDLKQEITLTNEMFTELYARDATQAGFQPGEKVRAIDLLYGVMLPSGGECCIGLATEISGSEEAFVELMNKKAKKLGMNHTHFCDTTGLHDPDHYSSAYDMAVLLKYALRNDTFREIITSPWHSTPGTNVHEDGITYYSTMFQGLQDSAVEGGRIMGGKTGYTDEAGVCLASFGEIRGREYILVTMGAPDQGQNIEDAKKVYNRIGMTVQEMSK